MQKANRMKSILVTGANSGLGLYITKKLQTDFHIFACSRSTAGFSSFEGLENVTPIILDVTIQDTIDDALIIVKNSKHELFGIVNNAGIGIFFPASLSSTEEFQRVFDVNVFGVHRVVATFVDLLIKNRGRIVNISSLAGIVSTSIMSAYAASKHALESYSDSLSVELKKVGVDVIVVEPGYYKSNLETKFYPLIDDKLSNYGEDKRLRVIRKEIEKWNNNALTNYPEPIPVANEVFEAFTSDKPKIRYLVTDEKWEAEITLKRAMIEFLQLNYDHKFSKSKEEIHQLLDELFDQDPRDLQFARV